MKKEILFVIGLITSAVVYCQTSSGSTPQLQMSGAAEQQKADTVSSSEIKRVAADAASSPKGDNSTKPKSENKAPVLTVAEPKKEY
jgi:hypothetical protein